MDRRGPRLRLTCRLRAYGNDHLDVAAGDELCGVAAEAFQLGWTCFPEIRDARLGTACWRRWGKRRGNGGERRRRQVLLPPSPPPSRGTVFAVTVTPIRAGG